MKEYGFKVKGPEPTRYGDWERKGRVSDFWFYNVILQYIVNWLYLSFLLMSSIICLHSK